ncbi:MAG: hypothetical protein CSA96_06935 [Bacteroidetes bacterium]|nr:MAG: hypothetical protein CSA96_06935 [Bacteroidota bacterium]
MPKSYYWIAALFLTVLSCRHAGNSEQEDYIPETDRSKTREAIDVIYAMNLPTDVVSLFEKTGTGFNAALLIHSENVAVYEAPEQMALLLGALGVDLSYCKLYGQAEHAAGLYRHIEMLAERLQIPEDVFTRTRNDIEAIIEKPDSMTSMITEIYSSADAHFKSVGQEALASLSLLGGWLEAMYIGVNIYQDKKILEVGDRILHQKYALTSLLGLLNNYQESLFIRQYVHDLEKLRSLFNEVEILYASDNFDMEAGENSFRAQNAVLRYSPETLAEICSSVLGLRNKIMP